MIFVKECLPCLLSQCVKLCKKAKLNEEDSNEVILKTLEVLKNYKKYGNAPEIAYNVSEIVKEKTGIFDFYIEEKDEHINKAFELLPEIESIVSDDIPLSLLFSAIGNSMDNGVYDNVDVGNWLIEEYKKGFTINDVDKFLLLLENAKNVLIIGDNSGESVIDGLLCKLLSKKVEVYYAVREKPILNDLTIKEAKESKLDHYAKVISSGSPIPGTKMAMTNEEFKDLYINADIVISKGQGNFETLYDEKRPIFFCLKAKCEIVAQYLNVDVNDYVFRYKDDGMVLE